MKYCVLFRFTGGGLGGKKESGQLRFGGRERPFRAPLRHIPVDDLKRLGITPPPEGRYMSRFQVPSPPRRKKVSADRDDYSRRHEERNPAIKQKRSQSPEPSSSDRGRRRSADQQGRSDKHHKRSRHSSQRNKRSNSHDHSSNDGRSSADGGRLHRHHRYTHEHDRWSPNKNSSSGD